MVVHCCHCRDCQRETGSAFVINAIVERAAIELIAGRPELVMTPSNSGKGQEVARCPTCHVALWSHYGRAGRLAAFVRAGTLADPDAVSPHVHIFTRTKLPWVRLPEDVPAFDIFYGDPDAIWPAAGRARWHALLAGA